MEQITCPFCGEQTEYIDEKQIVVACTNTKCYKVWEVEHTDKLKTKYYDRQK
jgi:hypothetical protein